MIKALVSQTRDHGFEPHNRHHALVVELAYTRDLRPRARKGLEDHSLPSVPSAYGAIGRHKRLKPVPSIGSNPIMPTKP